MNSKYYLIIILIIILIILFIIHPINLDNYDSLNIDYNDSLNIDLNQNIPCEAYTINYCPNKNCFVKNEKCTNKNNYLPKYKPIFIVQEDDNIKYSSNNLERKNYNIIDYDKYDKYVNDIDDFNKYYDSQYKYINKNITLIQPLENKLKNEIEQIKIESSNQFIKQETEQIKIESPNQFLKQETEEIKSKSKFLSNIYSKLDNIKNNFFNYISSN